ncbi:hypothetical protein Tco_1562022 [Tanacetum coccineum]
MSEVKKTDHSAAVLALIKSQVPTVVDKYLGTKLDDALLRVLERHTADLIEKYSVLPGPEMQKNHTVNRNPANYHLHHALMEALIADEDVMDKEVKDRDATNYSFKEDYMIVPKPRVVIFRDRNDQRKLMRLNEIHKFSDGTLTRVMEKLDHMIKDFHLFEYNKGMETRKWSEDDKRRSKDFISPIEKRLLIKRIFQSL